MGSLAERSGAGSGSARVFEMKGIEMRVLIRSYDLDDLDGSGITLRAIARYLGEQGDTVWATNRAHALDEIRQWSPHVIIGQQWATEEASGSATDLHIPFVM